MSGHADVGCSGWMYDDWKGLVYASQLRRSEWLAHYATLFDTVEINNTFYRLPPVTTVEQWKAQVPPGFVFSVKLGAFGSHRMKLRDAGSWLPNHLDRVLRLGDALGPTLVQLPPRWHANAPRLDEFLSTARNLAPKSTRWAVEVREPSWFHDEVYNALRHHNAALCIHDMLPDHPWILTADWTYLRFHGPHARERKYVGRYGGRRLWRVSARLRDWLDDGHDVYAYFNNDTGGDAVLDAQWLRRDLTLGSVRQ